MLSHYWRKSLSLLGLRNFIMSLKSCRLLDIRPTLSYPNTKRHGSWEDSLCWVAKKKVLVSYGKACFYSLPKYLLSKSRAFQVELFTCDSAEIRWDHHSFYETTQKSFFSLVLSKQRDSKWHQQLPLLQVKLPKHYFYCKYMEHFGFVSSGTSLPFFLA